MAKKLLSVIAACLIALSLGGAADVSRAEVTEGDLSGTYDFMWFGPGESGMEIDAAEIVFDGEGGWDMDTEYAGKYLIDEGRLVIEMTSAPDPDEKGVITDSGAISPDATFIGLPETEVADSPGYTILVKRDQDISAEDLAGSRYNYVDFFVYENEENPVVSGGFIDFDDQGMLTLNEEYSSNEIVDGEGEHISFSVENGYIIVEEASAEGVIGPNGNFIVLAVDSVDEQGIIFLSKAGNGETYDYDLDGWYNLTSFIADIGSEEVGVRSVPLLIDGANEEWSMTDPEDGELEGAYEVDLQGRMTIELAQPEDETEFITEYGAVSPDGNLFFIPEVDEDDLGISLAIQMSLPELQEVTGITSPTGAVVDDDQFVSEAKTSWELKSSNNVPDDFRPSSKTVSFTASSNSEDGLEEFTFETSGLEGEVSDKVLLKLIDNNYREFEYEQEDPEGNYINGGWWITEAGDYLDPSETLDPATTYTVHFVIEDDKDYDADKDSGEIEDPTVLGSSAQTTTDDSSSDDDDGGGGSSSSGCFINILGR